MQKVMGRNIWTDDVTSGKSRCRLCYEIVPENSRHLRISFRDKYGYQEQLYHPECMVEMARRCMNNEYVGSPMKPSDIKTPVYTGEQMEEIWDIL